MPIVDLNSVKFDDEFIPIDRVNFDDEFDPEGSGYDFKTKERLIKKYPLTIEKPTKYIGETVSNKGEFQAWVWHPELNDYGLHDASFDPDTGILLKGIKHKTIDKTIAFENAHGRELAKGDLYDDLENGRYYSVPKNKEDDVEITQDTETDTSGPIGATLSDIGGGFKEVAQKLPQARPYQTVVQTATGLGMGMVGFVDSTYTRVMSALDQLVMKGEIDPEVMKIAGDKRAELYNYQITDPGAETLTGAITSVPTGVKLFFENIAEPFKDSNPNVYAGLKTAGDMAELVAFGEVFKTLKLKQPESKFDAEKILEDEKLLDEMEAMDAEKIRKDAGQVQEARVVEEVRPEKSGEDLQLPEKEGAEAGITEEIKPTVAPEKTDVALEDVAVAINEELPGNGLKFDGVQEPLNQGEPVKYQWTPREGRAKGASFSTESADTEIVRSELEKKIGQFTEKPTEKTGEIIVGGGKPPATGLVVANIGADGKIYYGDPGDVHFVLSEKYGKQIRKDANLSPGESTWENIGWSDSSGKILSRKEALEKTGVKPTIPGELDALDYREQVVEKPAETITDKTYSGIPLDLIMEIGRDVVSKSKAWIDSGGRPNDIRQFVKGRVKLEDSTINRLMEGSEKAADLYRAKTSVGSEESFWRRKPKLDEILVTEYLIDKLSVGGRLEGVKHPNNRSIGELLSEINKLVDDRIREHKKKQFRVVGEETPETPQAKESWEMTPEEWISKNPVQTSVESRGSGKKLIYVTKLDKNKAFKTPLEVLEFEHKYYIQQALSEGKPVPKEVLDEYPDLAEIKKPRMSINERWDSAKLGVRVEWATRGAWITNKGKLSKTGEKIAESKWDDISPAAKNVLSKIIIEDYPSLKPPTAPETAKVRPLTDIAKDINTAFGERGEILSGKELTPEQQAAILRLRGDLDTFKQKAKEAGQGLEEYLLAQKFDPEVVALIQKHADDIPKYARSINLERQDIPEDYKAFEATLLDPKPKKTQTWVESEVLAEKYMKEVKTKSSMFTKAKRGQLPLTTEKLLAMRQINVNAIEGLKRVVEEGDTVKAAEALESYQNNIGHVMSDASSEVGRMLNIHKKDVAIGRLGAALTELKDGLNKRQFEELKTLNLEDPVQIQNFIKNLKDPKLSDYFMEYWYNMILSGPPTHVVNAVGNTLWLTYQVPHRASTAIVDSVYSTLRGKERQYFLNEIVPMLAGYKKGLKKGKTVAGQVLRTGKAQKFEDKWFQEMNFSIGAWRRSPNKTMRKIAPYIDVPTRALRAMDVWANAIAYDGEMASLARRASNKKGLRGAERNAFEKEFIKNPTDAAHETAAEMAQHSTFMDEPDPFTQYIVGSRNIPVIGPALRMTIMPFVNTISNLTKRGIELTPGLGIAKEAVSRGMGRGMPTPKLIAKQIEGSVIAFYVISKAAEGRITGPMPDSKSERDAWYRQGKKPWAINLDGKYNPETEELEGGTWREYRRYEPYNTVIASAYLAYDEIQKAMEEGDEKTATEHFGNFADQLKFNVIDGSYFSGLQQVFNRHGGRKGSVARWMASWVPYSSFFRSINRAVEVIEEGEAKPREGNDWLKAFAMTVPSLSGEMPAKINLWGDDSVIPGGVFQQWLPFKWSKATEDPVELELERLDLYPAPPNQTVKYRGEDIKLPDDVYKKYAMDFGKELKKNFAWRIKNPSWGRRDPKDRKATLKRIREKIARSARRRLVRNYLSTIKPSSNTGDQNGTKME